MKLTEIGEFGLIGRLQARLRQRGGVLAGIGDDAAILDAISSPVATCDALVEGVHFRRDWTSARSLGKKAMAVNVSDIAAMGGFPIAALITLGVPSGEELAFVEELYAGMEEEAAQHHFTIAGGDTVLSPSGLFLAITMLGNAFTPVLRGGARPGDIVLVTGTLGDSAAGLALLRDPDLEVERAAREHVLQRHREPEARLGAMHAALGTGEDGVTAGLDISDGLAGDAGHIADQSGVGIEIELDRLPISAACIAVARACGMSAAAWALGGGEDYELLLCVGPERVEAVERAIQENAGLAVHAIGRCAVGSGVTLIHPDGARSAAASGFRHF